LKKDFKKAKLPKLHTVFLIDRSGSMGEATMDKSKRKGGLTLDRVGDVLETGVMEFLNIRQASNILS
jgi:hypothetical protein